MVRFFFVGFVYSRSLFAPGGRSGAEELGEGEPAPHTRKN